MAENTIDNLSIQVVASAERAISTFNRLASGASGLKNAANGAAGGMQNAAQGAQDMGNATQQAGTQSGKARPNIKGVGKDAKDAGDNAKKGSSGLATFWQSLKRIAYYRMIRSIIKGIGQAFREGAQNLYQWSAANPSLSDFAKNMNRIATSVTYLKNSLGAMLEPIVRILTPVIEWVVDKLVWLIDKVNQFFAALSGAETYTAAKKVAQTWGDTSQQVANNTHKAAEEIKRTILGFDEINKLDKPNSGSYGGGSGLPSASAAAQDMFEERPLEGWAKTISDFIRKIKDFFDGIFGPIKQLFTDAGDAFDNLNRSLDAAQQEDKTVNINVKINTTAEKLWNDFVDEWNAIKDKILFFKISPTPPVDLLWGKITDAWDNIKDKVLYANVSLSQKASYLWTTLKDAWNNIKDKVLYSNVSLSQKANYLWTTLSNAWDGIKNKVLYADVMLSQKANYLWTTLSNAWGSIQGKVLYVDVMLSQKANYLWTTLQSAWDNIQNKVLYANVSLSQKATYLWDTLKKAWNSIQNKVVYLNVSLSQSANYLWTTLKNAWDGIQNKVVYANVSLSQSANYLWTTLKSAWDNIKGKVVYLTVEFTQKANYLWTTLKNAWDGIKDKVLYVEVKLKKNGWTTVTDFVDNSFGGATGGGGKTSGGGAGRNISVGVELSPTWSEGLGGISGALGISDETVDITANAKKGWKGSYKSKVGANDTTSTITANLSKGWGKQKPLEYLGLSGLTAVIKTKLQKERNNAVSYKIKAGGGTGKGVVAYELMRRGGVFSNGRWSDIPQYANGTLNAGTIFAAGEAGPEVVGHVGGRTEVLNKSQLASAMFSAVQAAMAPAAANFASAAQSMGVANVSFDFETLAEMVRQGVEQAMARSNDYDRQKVALLQQINEKDYNPEISTSSINKAQQRMNRRAGTTIVPVGT